MKHSSTILKIPLPKVLRVSLVWALLATGFAGRGDAQVLTGRLLDLDTNEPISIGVLTLLDDTGTRIRTAIADEGGWWSLEAPGAGVYFIEAKRLGYEPWLDGPVELQGEAELSFEYRLRPVSILLDPIRISAAATHRYLELSGFYRRQLSDFGHFVTPEDIEKRQAGRITDMLVSIPGVRRVSSGVLGSTALQLRGSRLSSGGICRPRVFVDGIMFLRGDARTLGVDEWGNPERLFDLEENPNAGRYVDDLNIDDIGHPSTIAAVEIYRSSAQVPVQFGGTSVETQCGVIVIWTKVGTLNRESNSR